MKTLWDPAARRELRDRIGRLQPGAAHLWGKMSAPQMVAHLVDSMRMANGDIHVPSRKMAIRFTPIKQFIIYLAPFPKGAPTAPQLLTRPPADWPGECGALCQIIELYGERGLSAPDLPVHPAFGRLTNRAWGVLTYRHIDHHLRQFGV